jgi:hypothetical protein
MNDLFEIKIEHLNKNSHYLVNVKCEHCEKEKEIEYKKYNVDIKNKGFYVCGECRYEKTRITNLEKYGVEHNSYRKETIEKRKQTNLDRYGTTCKLNTEEVQEQIKKDCLEKYGVDHSSKRKDVVDKRSKTNIEKYGSENVRELMEDSEDCINIPDLMDFLERYNNVVLVGGGINECLKEVELALDALDKNYDTWHKFTY